MKLPLLLSAFITSVILFSCIKHEVIPAPERKATLKAYFSGNINNSSSEFTENVNGYYGAATQSKIVLPSGQTSSVIYLFEMKSSTAGQNAKIQVGLGSLTWDQANSTGPDLTTFNNFFNSHSNPNYSNNGTSGFYVSYTDNAGVIWSSRANSIHPKSVNFSSISQESDPNGDYSKFTCTFSCYVYSNEAIPDSMSISNAQVKGWFQR
jgi:hypothetical protein